MRRHLLLVCACLLGCIGCEPSVRNKALESDECVANIAPAMLVGTWKSPYRVGSWDSLSFTQDGVHVSGTFILRYLLDDSNYETSYDTQELRLDGPKVYFYVDKIKSSDGSNLGLGSGRHDFYVTMATDGQSLDLYRKEAGQRDYVYSDAYKKKP
jgi:hypothetical protein